MSAQFFINKSVTVELPIPGVAGGGNTGTTFQFSAQTFLNNKKTLSIEVYSVADLPTSPLNNPLVTMAQLKTAYLTLYFQDPSPNPLVNRAGEYVNKYPLVALHRVQSGTDSFVWELPKFVGQIITWEKSFITIPTAFLNTTTISFLLNVSYEFKPDDYSA